MGQGKADTIMTSEHDARRFENAVAWRCQLRMQLTPDHSRDRDSNRHINIMHSSEYKYNRG